MPNCIIIHILTIEMCEDWPLLQFNQLALATNLMKQFQRHSSVTVSASAILRGWLYHRSRNLTVNLRYSRSPASVPVVVWAMPLCHQGDTCVPQSLWGHIPAAILLLGQPLSNRYERLRCSGNTDLRPYPSMASRPKMSV